MHQEYGYNKRKIGAQQECLAENYLKEHGYVIIEKNFFCKTGEIDVIAKKELYLIFIEVKYRSNFQKGMPEEAVDYRKQATIIQTARYYMLKNQISEDTPCRFDVVSILNQEIKIIEDAFMIE